MLLDRSLVPHDAFELKDVPPGIGNKAKKSRGACRRKMAPLTFPGHFIIAFTGAQKAWEKGPEVNLASVDIKFVRIVVQCERMYITIIITMFLSSVVFLCIN